MLALSIHPRRRDGPDRPARAKDRRRVGVVNRPAIRLEQPARGGDPRAAGLLLRQRVRDVNPSPAHLAGFPARIWVCRAVAWRAF